MTTRRFTALAVVVAALNLLTACSDGKADDGAAANAVSARREPTGSTTTTTTTTEPEDPVELDGTAWRLTAIEDDGAVVDTSEEPVPAVVTFDGEDVEVYDGVNTASGEYSIDGASVTIDLDSATELAYPTELLPQHELIELLPSVATADADDEELQLELAEGPVLRFELSMGITPG